MFSHGLDLPVLEPDDNIEYDSDSERSYLTVFASDDEYKPEKDDHPVPLTQTKFNDPRRNLYLLKESAQRPEKIIFHVPGKVLIRLLQQHCWIDPINVLRI